MSDLERDVLHLIRLALDGRSADITALSRRLLRDIGRRREDLDDEVQATLSSIGSRTARSDSKPSTQVVLPTDSDSRLELLRREDYPILAIEPVWTDDVGGDLQAIVAEHRQATTLADRGIHPTRSVLFVGPPGVGKTLAARWLAVHMRLPLLTLDLTAVMSSFLGRTGNNIRVVLDFARAHPSVLLLDEFDALAKRRDDAAEIGELKRLVTVLLQEIDDWPAGGLLVAATNHPGLLDTAVWRRFDRTISFPLPSAGDLALAIKNSVAGDSVDAKTIDILAALLLGQSFSDGMKEIERARRTAAVQGVPTDKALADLIAKLALGADRSSRAKVAKQLVSLGRSQHEVARALGMSRDTIRRSQIPGASAPAARRSSKGET
jgi:SpoVK/Ycf46/Vps4 family AAA+-type ATPase